MWYGPGTTEETHRYQNWGTKAGCTSTLPVKLASCQELYHWAAKNAAFWRISSGTKAPLLLGKPQLYRSLRGTNTLLNFNWTARAFACRNHLFDTFCMQTKRSNPPRRNMPPRLLGKPSPYLSVEENTFSLISDWRLSRSCFVATWNGDTNAHKEWKKLFVEKIIHSSLYSLGLWIEIDSLDYIAIEVSNR